MKTIVLSRPEATVLATLAIFGLLVPNGLFVYHVFAHTGMVRAAFANPIAQVFIFEAFFLMFLFAWLLRRAQVARPTAPVFIGLSLVGGMVFSVPATLWLMGRERNSR